MASTKEKQDDLRRLMKERRENLYQKGKIDSPFAKYIKGQLSCSICNVVIKSNNLWAAHIAGKVHKKNLTNLKKSNSEKDFKTPAVLGVKRTAKPIEAISKKVKTEVKSEETQTAKPASVLASYSSSDESDDDEQEAFNTTSSQSVSNSSLPSDFFDNTATNALVSSSSSSSQPEKGDSSVIPTNNVETLPEGFFDDPVLDAKARNIEYKDPVEEEWEKFQKTIAEETNVSKTIIEEDLEESTLERDIVQIDEQIQQWERVKNLQTLADDVKMKAPAKDDNDDESGSADEELEEDDLLDWRSKGVKKL